MHDRLIRLSKYLAKHLRHAPHEVGLTLQPGGWAPVDDLLAGARKHGFQTRARRAAWDALRSRPRPGVRSTGWAWSYRSWLRDQQWTRKPAQAAPLPSQIGSPAGRVLQTRRNQPSWQPVAGAK